MITHRQLATLRAALRFWQEEMVPHGAAAAQAYLESPETEPLTVREVDDLDRQFEPERIRYGLYAPETKHLTDLQLFATAAEALSEATDTAAVVSVLLPLETKPSSG